MKSKLLTILSPESKVIADNQICHNSVDSALPEYSEMTRHHITDPLIDGIVIFLISVNQLLKKIH